MKSDDCKYFRWLVAQIDNGDAAHYGHLLNDLFDIEYTWNNEMDRNRAADGLYLRNEFKPGYRREIGCSILEMLVALSVRFEHDVMGEPGDEDAARWFWLILRQLDLDIYTDENYDFVAVDALIRMFLNGEKPIFEPKISGQKLANSDLWYQLGALANEHF